MVGTSSSCGTRRALVTASARTFPARICGRSEEHTSELQSLTNLVCRLLLEKKKKNKTFSNKWGKMRTLQWKRLYRTCDVKSEMLQSYLQDVISVPLASEVR